MSRYDWFRNTEWDQQTEKHFFAKLARAKRKAQYLRIQASTLSTSRPQVALDLLDKYFAIGDHWDDATAYVNQADAYLAIGDEDAAITAYEHALAREQEFPNLRTEASINFPFLIATRRRRDKYERALQVLGKAKTLLFPEQVFKREASTALISADLGDEGAARCHATRALEMADAQNSGLRYHPDLGIVGARHESTRSRLAAIIAG